MSSPDGSIETRRSSLFSNIMDRMKGLQCKKNGERIYFIKGTCGEGEMEVSWPSTITVIVHKRDVQEQFTLIESGEVTMVEIRKAPYPAFDRKPATRLDGQNAELRLQGYLATFKPDTSDVEGY